MANIDLKGIYNLKLREFGLEGSGVDRFDLNFIDAANHAIGQINRKADLATRIARVDSTESTVTLDDQYTDVLSDGITFFLVELGQRPARGADLQMGALVTRFRKGIDDIRADILNQIQSSNSEDTVSVAALGALG